MITHHLEKKKQSLHFCDSPHVLLPGDLLMLRLGLGAVCGLKQEKAQVGPSASAVALHSLSTSLQTSHKSLKSSALHCHCPVLASSSSPHNAHVSSRCLRRARPSSHTCTHDLFDKTTLHLRTDSASQLSSYCTRRPFRTSHPVSASLTTLCVIGTGTTLHSSLCPAKTAAGPFWNIARHFDGCERRHACIVSIQSHPLLTSLCLRGKHRPQQSPKWGWPWHRTRHLASKSSSTEGTDPIP